MKKSLFIPLNLRFFNEDSGPQETMGQDAQQEQQPTNQENQQTPLTTEAINKLIQSKVDKITAELGKKNAGLQKELEKLKREKLSDEEVKQLEIADKEKAIADKEKELLDKENRLFAIKAMKEIGLDDGSDTSLQIVDFVMADSEETITERVKIFKSLVDKLVTEKVAKTFKANGRVPNGGSQNPADKNNVSIAERLGKERAEQQKKSNDVLNHYLGGRK
ncbi:MAG: DUF4355 domain-containing protein [Clostridia bacterium]|nr:DUF4355 domain-containing protein [Clostridia bacterium]